MIKALLTLLKITAVTLVVFVADFLTINVVLPRLFGQFVVYPWLPTEYFYLYAIGCTAYVGIRLLTPVNGWWAFGLGVVLVYFFNLFLLINEQEQIVEYLKTVLQACILSAVLYWLYKVMFKSRGGQNVSKRV